MASVSLSKLDTDNKQYQIVIRETEQKDKLLADRLEHGWYWSNISFVFNGKGTARIGYKQISGGKV